MGPSQHSSTSPAEPTGAASSHRSGATAHSSASHQSMRPFDIDRNSGNNFHQGHESDFSHLGTWITSEARGSPIDTESDQVNYELLLPTPMTPPRHSPSGGGDQASDGATLAPFEASGLVVVDIPPVPSGTEEDATTCAVGVEDHASQSPSQAAASVQQLEATKEKKR